MNAYSVVLKLKNDNMIISVVAASDEGAAIIGLMKLVFQDPVHALLLDDVACQEIPESAITEMYEAVVLQKKESLGPFEDFLQKLED